MLGLSDPAFGLPNVGLCSGDALPLRLHAAAVGVAQGVSENVPGRGTNFTEGAMITDQDRAEWLRSGGYLPDGCANRAPSELVDWAIKNRYCPAYWRQPKPGEVGTEPPRGNGLIFVKRGDRNRIDECIQREREKK